MRDAKYVLGPMRLPFLLLTPACVLLGIGAALRTSGRLNALEVILVLVGGVAAHTSVNAFNEYCDFRSGLDARTVRTPFSGGSGTLPAKPVWRHLPAMCSLGLTTLALAIPAAIGAFRHAETIEKLIPYLAMNVILTLATPVLVAIGLFIG